MSPLFSDPIINKTHCKILSKPIYIYNNLFVKGRLMAFKFHSRTTECLFNHFIRFGRVHVAVLTV